MNNIKKIVDKCLNCNNPHCLKKCPLENNIPKIIKLIDKGLISEAKSLLLSTTDSSPVCSYLCNYDASCYGGCVLNKSKDGGVAFFEIEKFLSKMIDENDYNIIEIDSPRKVAIVGGGISGITAAIQFAKAGHTVKIFEKNEKIGGVITESLPNFRFNDQIIDKYINILLKLKVEIAYKQEFGKNLAYDELNAYDIVIFALGTSKPKQLFKERNGIYDGLTLLKKAKENQLLFNNKNVVVIGGGNLAIDIARTLVRNNNNVSIVYRRDILNSPASKKEIQDAIDENVKFVELRAPIKPIYNNEGLIGLEVEETKIIDSVINGRKEFVLNGKKEIINGEIIVEAIGLNAEYYDLKEHYKELFDDDGWVKRPGIYANGKKIVAITGDYLIGASSFAKASATSRKTSQLILELIK